MKIALATIHNKTYKALAEITTPLMRRYCEAHGYEFCLAEWGNGDYDSWWRVGHIRTLMRSFDVVFWVDCDALIMNGGIRVEDAPPGDVLMCEDIYGLNDGTSITRPTPWAEMFWYAVDTGRALVNDKLWGCNEAVIRFAQTAPYRDRVVTVLPQNAMNSYLMKEYGRPETWPGNYRDGDWILHLVGLPMERRLQLAREYAPLATV